MLCELACAPDTAGFELNHWCTDHHWSFDIRHSTLPCAPDCATVTDRPRGRKPQTWPTRQEAGRLLHSLEVWCKRCKSLERFRIRLFRFVPRPVTVPPDLEWFAHVSERKLLWSRHIYIYIFNLESTLKSHWNIRHLSAEEVSRKTFYAMNQGTPIYSPKTGKDYDSKFSRGYELCKMGPEGPCKPMDWTKWKKACESHQ